jgi:YHS domain-containing protein
MKTRMVIVALLLAFSLQAQTQNRRLAQFNLENKVAIQGHDPVAYFKESKAVKGKRDIASSYQGVVYYFATDENRMAFLRNPSGYEPQYGGWCAFAMGDHGEKVEVDPETFKIVNGKLFLFYNKYFNNTLKSWNKDEANLKQKADSNWRKISGL